MQVRLVSWNVNGHQSRIGQAGLAVVLRSDRTDCRTPGDKGLSGSAEAGTGQSGGLGILLGLQYREKRIFRCGCVLQAEATGRGSGTA